MLYRTANEAKHGQKVQNPFWKDKEQRLPQYCPAAKTHSRRKAPPAASLTVCNNHNAFGAFTFA